MSEDLSPYPILRPDTQIDLYAKLQAVRNRYLYEAMKATISDPDFDLETLEKHIKKFVPAGQRKKLTAASLSVNVFFPVPYLLQKNPSLLGYYRLLLGFSKKAFYGQGPFGRFAPLESRGTLPSSVSDNIAGLCVSLCQSAIILVDDITPGNLQVVNELILMTLGAEFRGSRNVQTGVQIASEVRDLLIGLLSDYDPAPDGKNSNRLTFRNDSGRTVVLEMGSDPDVTFTQIAGKDEHKVLAAEIKGGRDISNIWNRLGEAEKSHETARLKGFNERWTISRIDLTSDPRQLEKAHQKSPSTTRFYCLESIVRPSTPECADFRNRLGTLLGVRLP